MIVKVYRSTLLSGVGWFPFVSRWRHLRNTAFAEYVKRSANPPLMRELIAGLFKTGNQDPPESIFVEHSTFLGYLRTKEYRGAIALYDTLIADHGSHLDFSSRHLDGWDQIGFTPFPLLWRVFWVRRFLPAWRGEGDEGHGNQPAYTVDRRQKVIIVNFKVKYRIGSGFRRVIAAITQREPPYVWMQIECIFDLVTGIGKARVHGTAVPNQVIRWSTHRDGLRRLRRHEMTALTLPAIRSVFDCDVETAPRHFSSRWLEARIT